MQPSRLALRRIYVLVLHGRPGDGRGRSLAGFAQPDLRA